MAIVEKIMRVLVVVEEEEGEDPITADDWDKLGRYINHQQVRSSDGLIGRIEFIEWED